MPTVADLQLEMRADRARVTTDLNQISRTVDQFGKRTARTNQQVSGSNRNLRASFGQLGFQVQDVAVQLQGGQSALLVLGQQGSQVASIFGPGGAIIGAFLAVGAAAATALIPALMKGQKAAKEAEEANKRLADSYELVAGRITGLSDELRILAATDPGGARLRFLALIELEAKRSQGAVKKLKDFLDKEIGGGLLGGFFGTSFSEGAAAAARLSDPAEKKKLEALSSQREKLLEGIGPANLRDPLQLLIGERGAAVSRLQKKLGLSESDASRFTETFGAWPQLEPSVEAAKQLQQVLQDIDAEGPFSVIADQAHQMAQVIIDSAEGVSTVQKELEALETGPVISDDNQAVLDGLQREIELLGLSAEARARKIALEKLDATATGDTSKQAEALVATLHDKRQAIEAELEAQRQANQLKAEADAIINSLLTPLERHNMQLERATQLHDMGQLSAEELTAREAQLTKTLEDQTGVTAANNRVLQESESLYRAMRTPLERLNAEKARYQELNELELISEETLNRARRQADERYQALRRAQEQTGETAAQVVEMIHPAVEGLRGAFVSAFSDIDLSGQQMVRNFIGYLNQMVAHAAATKLSEALFPEGLFSALFSAVGGSGASAGAPPGDALLYQIASRRGL